MKSNYLIDYESVRENGLLGISKLPAGDLVYLFYTKNSDQLKLEFLDEIKDQQTAEKIILCKANTGRQFIEMYLATILGSLIGSDSAQENRYIIVSRDCDFLGIQSYWNDQLNKNLVEISTSIEKAKLPDLFIGDKLEQVMQLRRLIQSILEKNEKSLKKISYVSSIAATYYGEENSKQLIFENLHQIYGETEGQSLFDIIAPIL